jgi:hypothetical protein
MYKRTQQLGINYGTAVARLDRQLLFIFAKRLKMVDCFRCGKAIENLNDFTIEHKEPWLDVSVELFWDIENIAFSHHRCNSKATRITESKRIASRINIRKTHAQRALEAPEGKAWCSGHKGYLENIKFDRNKRNVNGLACYCRECREIFG